MKNDQIKLKPMDFDATWREELSMIAGMPLDYNAREPFRLMAKAIWEKMDIDMRIEAAADDAFNQGYDEGAADTKASLVDDLNTLDNKIAELIEDVTDKISKDK
jgi:hypothetical protein